QEEGAQPRAGAPARVIKAASIKHSHSRTETMRLPISDGARNSSARADSLQSASPSVSKGGSKRIKDPSRKRSSKRLDYKENEKLIKIEERLTSGARRPAASTAAGGATVAGRWHRDGTRPATGSHNPQAVRLSYLNPTKNLAAPPL
ncbi:hypothetical protein ACLOJK_036317, partial [Asimina triloba]